MADKENICEYCDEIKEKACESGEEKPGKYVPDRHFKFFQNSECEFFPCHKTSKPEEFNCLFCYCPLYTLGKNCGGNFKHVEGQLKDCSNCMLPHVPSNYDYIIGKYEEILKIAEENMK